MNNKFIIYLIISAIIFYGLGFLSHIIIFDKNTGCLTEVDIQNSFEDGVNTTIERLQKKGAFLQVDETFPVKEIAGTISRIESNKIFIKTTPLNPLDDPNLDERTVLVNSTTKIYQYVKKDEQAYQQELRDFNRDFDNSNLNAVPPEMYYKKDITISDLQVGQNVYVTTDIDIQKKKLFNALEITIYPN